MKQQDVFHPIINFFRSGVLIVFAPLRFLREFAFLQGSWQRSLGFGLGYKILTALGYGIAVQLVFLTPLIQAFRGIQFPSDREMGWGDWEVLFQWLHLPSEASLIAIPLLHIPSAVFWAGVLWGVMRLARCEVNFRVTFNFVNLFSPYALFYALVFSVAALFLNSLQTLVLMGIVTGFFLFLSLVLMTRTFHYGIKEAIKVQLQQDSRALWRFYGVLTLISLIPCIFIILGAWLLRAWILG